VTVSEAIVHRLQAAGFGSGQVYISPPDNSSVYEQIVIPPMNVTESMKFLQEVYGIFSSGLRFFVAREGTFVLPADFSSTVLRRRGEPSSVAMTFYETSQPRQDHSGTFYREAVEFQGESDRPAGYSVISPNGVQFTLRDTTTRELEGEVMKVMWSSQETHDRRDAAYVNFGTTVDSPIGVSNDPSKLKQRLFWQNYSNPAALTEKAARAGRTVLRAQLLTSATNSEVWLPHRRIVFHFEDARAAALYDGTYLLNVRRTRLPNRREPNGRSVPQTMLFLYRAASGITD
jgi:hypothetical protein